MSWSSIAAGAIGAAVGFGAGVGVGAANPGKPPIKQIGTFIFLDHTDLATRVMTVTGEGATFRPQFINQGFESGGAHYIWFYMWPFNNPGEVTVDIGMIADLWIRPNKAWSVEIANFDYNPKVCTLDDGLGHRAAIALGGSVVFLDLTQF